MRNKTTLVGALSAALLLASSTFAAAQASATSVADPKKQRKGVENFLKADKNEDGLLSRREFKKLIDLNAKHNLGEADVIQRANKYNVAFSLLDTDQDKSISLNELGEAARKAGQ